MNRTISQWLKVLSAALLISVNATAATCDPLGADEALKAEDARYAAQTTNDFAAMEKLYSPDLVYVHSSAVVDSKDSYINSMRSGTVQYKVMRR